ncbi:NB-ARC domain-containing protein [Planotetraspora sp. GP83]|uniref:NB-ARC domain-containing protein n=1 Tax=Planotetraspora sp. GP83 TaxID=3156264 RepID=UPI003515B1CB
MLAAIGSWWVCDVYGLALDETGIIVGLVVGVLATPTSLWVGKEASERVGRRSRLDLAEEKAPADPPQFTPEGTPLALDVGAAQLAGVPPLIGYLPRAPKAFQWRTDLMERIGEALAGGRPAAVCSLTGARGVGKTQLAAAYARSSLDSGVPVAWLTAETQEQLFSGLDTMAQALNIRILGEDSIRTGHRVREWLEGRRVPYLIIFDNAVDPDLLSEYLPTVGHAQVLITTNRQEFGTLADMVPVDRFTTDEALAFLHERVGPADGPGARALIDEVDHLPLALALAATRIVGPPRLSYAQPCVSVGGQAG